MCGAWGSQRFSDSSAGPCVSLTFSPRPWQRQAYKRMQEEERRRADIRESRDAYPDRTGSRDRERRRDRDRCEAQIGDGCQQCPPVCKQVYLPNFAVPGAGSARELCRKKSQGESESVSASGRGVPYGSAETAAAGRRVTPRMKQTGELAALRLMKSGAGLHTLGRSGSA